MSGTLRTDLDLYRIGDSNGPGLDAVRSDLDVSVHFASGIAWVTGSPNGGVSMRSSIYRLRRSTSRWWRLPAESPYSAFLGIRNDHGSHWLVEPARDMPLAQYIELLKDLSALFVSSLLRSVAG